MQSTKTSTYSAGPLISQDQLKSRQATIEDLDYVVSLAKQFHGRSIWRDAYFDEDYVRDMAKVLLLNGGVFINSAGGFVAGTVSPLLFSPTTMVAVELAWFAPNGGGRELRESFENYGRERGATIVQLCLLGDENFDKNHENLSNAGFSLSELQYVKVL